MTAHKRPGPDLSGTDLEGAYRLVRLIGQGGMGVVYEAIQFRLKERRVAVKIMSQSAVSDQVSLERFHREAEITSKLGHPHLVNVVDFGIAQSGQPYIVMEYLEGEDLDRRLSRCKRLAPEIVARIVVQTASALGAAHAQNVVHRDMKPGNIFLLQVSGEPEFVKVLDFGISKIKASNAKRLTREQMVVGTPCYMSPEQATGRDADVDHHADQWALACIAWEMLCGHSPFIADDARAVMCQLIRAEPPSLSAEVPGLRPEIEEVLRRALCRSHLDRYPSIREFARAFECAVKRTGLTRRFLPRWSLLAAALLISILFVVATVRSFSVVPRKPVPTAPAPMGSQSSRPPTQVEVVEVVEVSSMPEPLAPAAAAPLIPASSTPVKAAGHSSGTAAQKHTVSKAKAYPAQSKHRLFEEL